MKNILFALAIVSSSVNAIEVSRGMGESTFSSSKERLSACTIAENKAINSALINFAGREFTANKETRCIDTQKNAYCDYLKEITSSAAGTVRSIVDRSRKIRANTCFVEVSVEIEKSKSINAFAKSKRIYLDGEYLDLDIKIGQPVYLYIFNLHSNGVDFIFPNIYNNNELIDDRFVFPKNMFKAVTKMDLSQEALLILFTTQRQEIHSNVTLKELKQIITSIPNFEKKVVQHNFIIKRSER